MSVPPGKDRKIVLSCNNDIEVPSGCDYVRDPPSVIISAASCDLPMTRVII